MCGEKGVLETPPPWHFQHETTIDHSAVGLRLLRFDHRGSIPDLQQRDHGVSLGSYAGLWISAYRHSRPYRQRVDGRIYALAGGRWVAGVSAAMLPAGTAEPATNATSYRDARARDITGDRRGII